ncbi:MAG: ATP-dependent sacrificial sulfur transferase LarE [Clostridium sp.]|nr:ATP-dependent sacrificial sulfur transferase LarE [Clostridium sp.]
MERVMNISAALNNKFEGLKRYLNEFDRMAVAFSGGVDSTFLLKTAHEVMGDRVVAVTVQSCFFPAREMDEARTFCQREGIRQIICEGNGLEIEGLADNPKNRCYLCKKNLLEKMWHAVERENIHCLVEGSNADDERDYRPGMQAVAELNVKSPLKSSSLTKEEIRILSKALLLPTWEKPSFACLASRIAYGEKITAEKLNMIDKGEQLLLECGFRQVRVRFHGMSARIEVMPEELEKLVQEDIRKRIVSELKQYGFHYVSVDLQGYRTGSMNETVVLE